MHGFTICQDKISVAAFPIMSFMIAFWKVRNIIKRIIFNGTNNNRHQSPMNNQNRDAIIVVTSVIDVKVQVNCYT